MNTKQSVDRHIWASFPDYDMAAKAIAAFIDHGVPKDNIHLLSETIPSEYGSRQEEINQVGYDGTPPLTTPMYNADPIRNEEGLNRTDPISTPMAYENNRNNPSTSVQDTPESSAQSHAEKGLTVTTGGDAAIGAGKGLGVGLGVGILAGIAALVVPGFGIVLGGGALAIAIAGAAGTTVAGALAGATAGYLKDQGADAETTQFVTGRLSAGECVVNVNVDINVLTEYDADVLIEKYGGTVVKRPLLR